MLAAIQAAKASGFAQGGAASSPASHPPLETTANKPRATRSRRGSVSSSVVDDDETAHAIPVLHPMFGPKFQPARDAFDPPRLVILAKSTAIREDKIITTLREGGVVVAIAASPRDVPSQITRLNAEAVLVCIMSDDPNADAIVTIERMKKAKLQTPLMVYTMDDPLMFPRTMALVQDYGLAALFHLPLQPESLLQRLYEFVERQRKTSAIFSEVSTLNEQMVLIQKSGKTGVEGLKEVEQRGTATPIPGQASDLPDSSPGKPELVDGLVVRAPSRDTPRQARTSGGLLVSVVRHATSELNPRKYRSASASQEALSRQLATRGREKMAMAIAKAKYLQRMRKQKQASVRRRRRKSFIKADEGVVLRRRSGPDETADAASAVASMNPSTPTSGPQRASPLNGQGQEHGSRQRITTAGTPRSDGPSPQRRRHSATGLDFQSSFKAISSTEDSATDPMAAQSPSRLALQRCGSSASNAASSQGSISSPTEGAPKTTLADVVVAALAEKAQLAASVVHGSTPRSARPTESGSLRSSPEPGARSPLARRASERLLSNFRGGAKKPGVQRQPSRLSRTPIGVPAVPAGNESNQATPVAGPAHLRSAPSSSSDFSRPRGTRAQQSPRGRLSVNPPAHSSKQISSRTLGTPTRSGRRESFSDSRTAFKSRVPAQSRDSSDSDQEPTSEQLKSLLTDADESMMLRKATTPRRGEPANRRKERVVTRRPDSRRPHSGPAGRRRTPFGHSGGGLGSGSESGPAPTGGSSSRERSTDGVPQTLARAGSVQSSMISEPDPLGTAALSVDLLQLEFKEPQYLFDLATFTQVTLKSKDAAVRRRTGAQPLSARGKAGISAADALRKPRPNIASAPAKPVDDEEEESVTKLEPPLIKQDQQQRQEEGIAKMEETTGLSGDPAKAPKDWLLSKISPALAASLQSKTTKSSGSQSPISRLMGARRATTAEKDIAQRLQSTISSNIAAKLLGRGQKAKEALEEIREETADTLISVGQHLLRRGFELRLAGDLPKAIAAFTQAIDAEPSLIDARICRGVTFTKMAMFDEAFDDFSAIIRTHPRCVPALFNRALVSSRVGNDTGALADLDMAITLDPVDADLYHNRALIHRRQGNFMAAQEDYQRVYQLRKRPVGALVDADADVQRLLYNPTNIGGVPPLTTAPISSLSILDVARLAKRNKLRSFSSAKRPKPATDDPALVAERAEVTRKKAEAELMEATRKAQEAEEQAVETDLPSLIAAAAQKVRDSGGGPAAIAAAVARVRREYEAQEAAKKAENDSESPAIPAPVPSPQSAASTVDPVRDVIGHEGEDATTVGGVVTADSMSPSSQAQAEGGRTPTARIPSPLRRAVAPVAGDAPGSIATSEAESNESKDQPTASPELKTTKPLIPYHSLPDSEQLNVRPRDSLTQEASEASTKHQSGMRTMMRRLSVTDDSVKIPDASESDILRRVYYEPTPVQRALRLPSEERSYANIRTIMQFLSALSFVGHLTLSVKKRLCETIKYTALDPGHLVCAQGAPPTDFYILMSGSCDVKTLVANTNGTNISMGSIGPGTPFGEIGLVRGKPRAVSIITKEACELLWITGEEFKKLGLHDYFKRELYQRLAVIERAGVFATLSEEQKLDLAAVARPLCVPGGTVLQRQGDVPTSVFLLTRGVCDVMKTADDEAALMRRLKEIREEIQRLTTSDVYHHSLRPSTRHPLSMPRLSSPSKASTRSSHNPDAGLNSLSSFLDPTDKPPSTSRIPSSSALAAQESPPPPTRVGELLSEALEAESKLASEHRTPVGCDPRSVDTGRRVEWLRSRMQNLGLDVPGGGGNALHRTQSVGSVSRLDGSVSLKGLSATARSYLKSRGRLPGGGRDGKSLTRERPGTSSGARPGHTGFAPLSKRSSSHSLRPSSSGTSRSKPGVRHHRSFSSLRQPDLSEDAFAPHAVLAESLGRTIHPSLPGPAIGETKSQRETRLSMERIKHDIMARADSYVQTVQEHLSHACSPAVSDVPSAPLSQTLYVPRGDDLHVPPLPQISEPSDPKVEKSRALRYRTELEAEERRIVKKLAAFKEKTEWKMGKSWHRAVARSLLGGKGPEAGSDSDSDSNGDAKLRPSRLRHKPKAPEAPLSILVAKLFPVSVFGEMALLDPWEGVHQGTVVTDTYAEMLTINKNQLHIREYGSQFLKDARRKAISFPSAREVKQKARAEAKWSEYKAELMTELRQRRK